MAKINEYPQAVTINNNDLFVIDQESGGDHATKSASVSQIADKATSGVQSQIGDLSSLTTTNQDSLVDAVNEVNGKVTPQTITITPNTTVATGFDYSVVKVGKIVVYYISCQLTSSITATGTVIASGLPKAVRDTQIPVTALSGANAGQTNQMAIMTDGKFQTRYTSTGTFPSGAYMLASGCYITSE